MLKRFFAKGGTCSLLMLGGLRQGLGGLGSRAFASAGLDKSGAAMMIITKRVPDHLRGEYMKWQSEGPELVGGVIGNESSEMHHFMPHDADVDMDLLDSRDIDSDTIVILFKNRELLEQWRSSTVRKEWLERGAHLSKRSGAVVVNIDDGSLGGFIAPSREGSVREENGSPAAPPSKWKVGSAVLTTIYPTVGIISFGIMPAFREAVPDFTLLPMSVQLFAQCIFTVAVMVNVLPRVNAALNFHLKPSPSLSHTAKTTGAMAGIYAVLIASGDYAFTLMH